MIGESLSGLVISISRIMTKLLIKDEQMNTLIFFVISIFIIAVCLFINYLIKDDPFVVYYVNNCKKVNSNLESYVSTSSLNTMPKNATTQDNGIELIVKLNQTGTTVDVPKSDSTEFDLPFGIDEEELVFYVQQSNATNSNHLQTNEFRTTTTSSCLPNYGCKRSSSQTELETNLINPTDSQHQSNLENLIGNSLRMQEQQQHSSDRSAESKITNFLSNYLLFIFYFKQNLAKGLEERLKIAYIIYPHMISICLNYLLSISLFPGIESEVENCRLKSWTPIILFTIFNLGDLAGKYVAKHLFSMNGQKLMFFSSIRFLLLPLFILCIVPNDEPILSNFFFIFVLTTLLAISNGIFGSLPMILSSKFVANKELAGNLMTLSYCVGLSLGTLLSYVIEGMFFDVKNHHSTCSSDSHD